MAVASALHRAGWDVFTPLFAPHSRVDLIVIGPRGVLRVQCKTSRPARGALYFRTCSNTANVPVDYLEQIDAFGVYSPDLHRVYLVPINDLPVRGGTLRLEPARNGQQVGVRWAKDYLVGPP